MQSWCVCTGQLAETRGRHFVDDKISWMLGGCFLSFLLSIAGRGPIWPRQRLPWLRPISRFGTGAPSSALLSRFAVNKEKALPHLSRNVRLWGLRILSRSRDCAREAKRFLSRARYGYFSERWWREIVYQARESYFIWYNCFYTYFDRINAHQYKSINSLKYDKTFSKKNVM